ncbi:MAG: hypothetical protein AAFZ38_08390 [Myxococcota bacterium]
MVQYAVCSASVDDDVKRELGSHRGDALDSRSAGADPSRARALSRLYEFSPRRKRGHASGAPPYRVSSDSAPVHAKAATRVAALEAQTQPRVVPLPERRSLAQWLGLEASRADQEALLPAVVEGRLRRAQRCGEEGRVVQMELELRRARQAAAQAGVEIASPRIRNIELPSYRGAARRFLDRAQRLARYGDVPSTQSALLTAHHYAIRGEIDLDPRRLRKIRRRANLRAFEFHARSASDHASRGLERQTQMAVALARASFAAALENGAKPRSLDELEAAKVQARLNAIHNQATRT